MNNVLSIRPHPFRQGFLLVLGTFLGMGVLALLPLLMHHTCAKHRDFLARQVRLIPQPPEPFMEPPPLEKEPPLEPEPEIDIPPPELAEIPPPELPEIPPPDLAEPPPPDQVAPEPINLAPQPLGFETPTLSSPSVKGVSVRARPAGFKRNFARSFLPGKLARPKAPAKLAPPKIRFNSDELDRQPERISQIEPVYPYRAKRKGIEGVVAVKFLVDRSGAVKELTVTGSNPKGVFDATVIKTLGKWRFKPGRKDGKTVETWLKTKIRFKLD